MVNSSTWRVHGALFLASAIYGLFPVVVKLLMQHVSSWELMTLRLLLTAALVWALERLFVRGRLQQWSDLRPLTALSFIGGLAVQVLVVLGIQWTSVFHASLMMATVPIQTTLLSLALKREPFDLRRVQGIVIAFLGVAWLLWSRQGDGGQHQATSLLGDVLMLTNAFLFSCFLVGSQPLLKRYSSFSFITWVYVISAVILVLIWPLAEHWVGEPLLRADLAQRLTPRDGWLMAFVVLLASIGTYTLNSYALSNTRASTVSTYIFIQPLMAALLGLWLLREPLTWPMAVAGLLVVVGVIVSSRSSGPDPAGLAQPEAESAAEATSPVS